MDKNGILRNGGWTKDAAKTTVTGNNDSTMGGLLETSVNLQKGNMKFYVKKGLLMHGCQGNDNFSRCCRTAKAGVENFNK